MCETDRDHRGTAALFGGRNRRRNNRTRRLNGGTQLNGNDATTTTEEQQGEQYATDAPYMVNVSIRFLVTSLLASCLLAFCVGRAARIVMLGQGQDRNLAIAPQQQCEAPLPSILAKSAKTIPQTRYTSKNFDTSMSASSSSWLAATRDGSLSSETEPAIQQDWSMSFDPSAEHLMVDIKHVDSDFLNSERQLAGAIIQVMNEAELTLLSYHCHGLMPMGVSCVGVLLQNYISFHTWPEEGVITLDLCVGGGNFSLLPVLPILERAFGKPNGRYGKKPETRWAHRVRGFPIDKEDESQSHDLGVYVLGDLATDVKKEVASVETNFQKLDIYDVTELNNERPTLRQKDARHHAVVLRPDRVVMRDGWVESTLFHEAAYHEALVHPAMFSHFNPTRVAIIGGGEGASLREVLKHDTVQEAVLLEIDETILNVSKQYMPEWSDCSDLKGSAAWCIEDTRTKVYHEDGLAWFASRYANGNESSAEAPMDVVIMNALGAESETDYAEALYSNMTYMQSFYNSLSDDGVLVMQLGEAPDWRDPDETKLEGSNRVAALNLLEKVGFASIHVYEESHCGFGSAWTFIVAFKSYASRKLWYSNAAEIDLAIQKRTVQTKSGASSLRYFDGATMVSYQVPHRAIETVFCKREPAPLGCRDYKYTFDLEVSNVPTSDMEVKMSGQGDISGRGLYTKVDIANGTYVAAEAYPDTLRFYPSTYALIFHLLTREYELFEGLEVVDYYVGGYGFNSRRFGDTEAFVDSGSLTFVNHGCRGSYNVGTKTSYDEFTADLSTGPSKDIGGLSHVGTSVFNPVIDRHLLFSGDRSVRDIPAGSEILDNYLAFIGGETYWESDVKDLRAHCSGVDTEWSVNEYEHRDPSKDEREKSL